MYHYVHGQATNMCLRNYLTAGNDTGDACLWVTPERILLKTDDLGEDDDSE